MRRSRRLSAVLIAVFSLVLVFGALMTALAETGFTAVGEVKPTNTVIEIVEQQPSKTPVKLPTQTEKATSKPEATKTQKPEETAEKSATPTKTKTLAPTDEGTCTKPDGWTDYKVKSGDTLFSIAQLYETDYPTLQEGNCMGTSTRIITGQILWVPDNATKVPTKTLKPTTKATSKPLSPPKAATATYTFTPTPIPCYPLTLDIDNDSSTGTGGPPKPSIDSSKDCKIGEYTEGETITVTAYPDVDSIVEGWVFTNNTTLDPLNVTIIDKDNKITVEIVMPSDPATILVTYIPKPPSP